MSLRLVWLRGLSIVASSALAVGVGVLPVQAFATQASAIQSVSDTNADTNANVNVTTRSHIAAADTQLQSQSSPQQNADAMPQNPNTELPDTVNSSIPDNATVVSKDLAVTTDGTVKDLQTGKQVTDEHLVGSKDKPADPLAKTNGENFIPVQAKEVKQAVQQSQDSTQPSAYTVSPSRYIDASSNVQMAALTNNEYGAYWGSYQGYPAFFEYNGNPYIQNAKGVVDVSAWQGTIDWAQAKASGVEGAIIRISYGWDNGFDSQALRNIRECIRLGIPFSVYSYSYAYDTASARAEANDIVSLLRQAGVSPSTMSYPVFYDLEHWSWAGHSVPTDPAVYEAMVNTWMGIVKGAGYNGKVYSYTSYIDTALNRTSIRNQVGWVASYGAKAGFDIAGNERGWQYSSTGRVNGISGYVDLNAFGVKQAIIDHPGISLSSLGSKVTNIEEGDYRIASVYPNRYLEVFGATTEPLARIDSFPLNGGSNQIFHIKPIGNGAYQIIVKQSNLLFDASGPSSRNGTPIIQCPSNGGTNQQWWFYRTSAGTYLIASVYAGNNNKVIDIPNGNTDAGVFVGLWAANGGQNQQFKLEKVGVEQPKNGWVVEGQSKYWYVNGQKLTNRELQDPTTGKWYWLGSDGAMATGWVNLPDGRRVYYNPSTGTMTYGEAYIGGYWYYFRPTDGAMVRGITYILSNGGKWVYYNINNGHMMYGEQYVNYDAEHTGWYYFDIHSGAMAHGITYVLSNGGKWVYYDINTGLMQYGEQYINYDAEHTGWYLFDQYSGAMQYGDVYLVNGAKWVRYDRYTGIMVKGLQRYDNAWYYFDQMTGAMAHGWAFVPEWGGYHYFDPITGRG